MSLLDRVQSDFANVICNPDDFGQSFAYTPAGGAEITVAGIVHSQESRSEFRDGWRVRIDRLQFSGPASTFNPTLGAKIVFDGRTWDFQSVRHDRIGGRVSAYFESISDESSGGVSDQRI